MPIISVNVSCPVRRTFRVEQLAGMFDLHVEDDAQASFRADVPAADEPWDIGLIVGPSGSGKSTLARAAFGESLVGKRAWPDDGAVIDGFGDLPIKQVAGLLTAVGFSSPPSWLKPYRVLSNGEQFRCDLARALASQSPIVAFDEFTSVVDRNVARMASAAIAKAVRGGAASRRFVAVTCHYDVAEWLQADWVLDMASGQTVRRRLRRPSIELEVVRTTSAAWPLFATHHYLNARLRPGARCYLALWDGEPTAFCATLGVIGLRGRRRISRVVTLPDYQGAGIGMRLAEAVASLERGAGHRMNITGSHPAMMAHCRRSPLWKTISIDKAGTRPRQRYLGAYVGARRRSVASFEFVGP